MPLLGKALDVRTGWTNPVPDATITVGRAGMSDRSHERFLGRICTMSLTS